MHIAFYGKESRLPDLILDEDGFMHGAAILIQVLHILPEAPTVVQLFPALFWRCSSGHAIAIVRKLSA